jgi:hypothetical protein
MASVVKRMARVAGRLVALVASLLPSPPPEDGPAPDVDGRRDAGDQGRGELDAKMVDPTGHHR